MTDAPGEPGPNQPYYGPPAPPPQYGPPQYQPPQYQPPQYGPPQYQSPQYGPPSEPPQPYPLMPPPAPPAKRRGRLLSTLAAVVVLAGGGVATYIAVSDTSPDHGSASAKEAVQKIVGDINASDLIGMLDALAPAERASIADPLVKDFSALQREHVLSPSADLNHVSGASLRIDGLTYGPTITVNDHVQIVQLTGGTVHIDADASKLPFSSEFIKQVFPHGGLSGSQVQTVNIADAVRANGGKPVRVAAEKVGGGWYPSLMYTIADNAVASAGLSEPTASDAVPAVGAGTPEEAVRELVTALLDGHVTDAIKLAAPDELAALHDYGSLIPSSYPAAPIKIDDLSLTHSDGANGVEYVDLSSITLRVDGGGPITMAVDGKCFELTVPGQAKQRMCSTSTSKSIDKFAETFTGKPLTAAQRQAFDDIASGGQVGGIATIESGGNWYVAPVRTMFLGTTQLLDSLKGNDLLELIGLIREFATADPFSSGSASGGMHVCPGAKPC